MERRPLETAKFTGRQSGREARSEGKAADDIEGSYEGAQKVKREQGLEICLKLYAVTKSGNTGGRGARKPARMPNMFIPRVVVTKIRVTLL